MKKNWILPLAFILGSCLPVVSLPPEPTATPTMVPSPSSTVVWFPPTSTPEVQPTNEIISTPAIQSEVGEVVFRDDFTQPEDWTVPQSNRGLISIREGEINIVINESGTFLAATREKPDFQYFYAQITANPVLCSAKDEYGFLFRVVSREQYYRFGLTCGGEIRLDRISGGESTLLYSWTRSASLPAGAPSRSTLAVLASGDEINILINGDVQFSADNQAPGAGSFGVYARSTGDSPVTVSFSDLIVREVLER
jgi:hypothetical protein